MRDHVQPCSFNYLCTDNVEPGDCLAKTAWHPARWVCGVQGGRADWLFSDRDAEIERLREATAELSEQLAEARREIQIVAALKMALAHERKQLAAAKSQELIEARATIEGLLKRVRELEKELVFERLHKLAAAETKAAKPAPDDPRIAMKANRELRAKLRRMHQFYEDESSRKGIMAFSTYGKLMKCLHPDSKPSDAERSEACGLLGQWKQSADRARHHA